MSQENAVMDRPENTQSAPQIDLTYYEAQPPRMVDPKSFPPQESLRGKIGESILKLDDVIDAQYPWQILDHDSPGGEKRRNEVKQKKQDEVLGYEMTHTRYWRQFRTPERPPGDTEIEVIYTVGHTRKQSTTVESGIELALGIEKGVFSGALKASLKWTSTTEESFSETQTQRITQNIKGNRWYFYWQTMDEFTIYRREKANPDALVEVKNIVAPSKLVLVDSPNIKQLENVPKPLQASRTRLKPGDSTTFGGWVFANTKVSVKNLSNNDDGQVTLSWAGLGGKILVNVKPGKVASVSKYLPATFRAINSGVCAVEVWTDA